MSGCQLVIEKVAAAQTLQRDYNTANSTMTDFAGCTGYLARLFEESHHTNERQEAKSVLFERMC